METANFIRAERASQRLSQLKLSQLSGLSRYLISLFENGYREPTKTELSKIKAALARKKSETTRGGRNE